MARSSAGLGRPIDGTKSCMRDGRIGAAPPPRAPDLACPDPDPSATPAAVVPPMVAVIVAGCDDDADADAIASAAATLPPRDWATGRVLVRLVADTPRASVLPAAAARLQLESPSVAGLSIGVAPWLGR